MLMEFVMILAGGIGTRMGNIEKPKQFLELGDKPIIIHTIEKFLLFDEFKEVLVLVPVAWLKYTEDLLKSFNLLDKVSLVEGGDKRNETIFKGINYLYEHYDITEDDFVITHDAVRPFVSYRIIKDNIDAMNDYDCTDTVISAVDTIVQSSDGKTITSIPNRTEMFQGQTPQTFKIEAYKNFYENTSEDEKNILTDAAKIFVINNQEVKMVRGDKTNIKVTYMHDLRIAEKMIEDE